MVSADLLATRRIVRLCPRPYCRGTLNEDLGHLYTCGLCARQFTRNGEPVIMAVGRKVYGPKLSGRYDG